VAYVSDAGTPAVSDPGARLVAAVAGAGHRVLPIPGASSVAAALSVAGDSRGSGFRFSGFLPSKGAERQAALARCAADPDTVVLFEAPHRVAALLQDLAANCPARPVTLGRELTKQFETVTTQPAAALLAWLQADAQRSRGEFVLVLHATPAPDRAMLPAVTDDLLQALLATLPLRQAVALAAQATGAARNALYERALALKGPREGPPRSADAPPPGGDPNGPA
jgi:16S rRNA (cytidine1402-2'-O)-methyltransferase